ncbi:P-type DNA transfer ATPase VirB11 [Methylorubrum rhodesianum]|uniref:Type IV secretion system protein n=1 Tax=Methylorubrum rhodesianum TaxID=29427 RepID=A0ABU9ZK06_9HYPH
MTAALGDLSLPPPLSAECVDPERRPEALSPQRRVLERYLDPLRPYLVDECLTEIVVNQPGTVFTEGPNGWTRHDAPALTGQHLQNLALAAAAYTRQDITPDHPIVSTVLPGGERCQIVVPPAVPAGSVSLTIRKAARIAMTLDELERRDLFGEVQPATGALSIEEEELLLLWDGGAWRAFLELAVRTRRNIIISGATGSGKTTLAKGLVACIPAHERILTIEDTAELTVPHANHVRLLYSKDGLGIARIGPRELLESSLRMRPDRILLQELRDGTAFYYLRNVNSGHPGSITTVHADSARLAFEQLTLLVKESAEGRDLARDDIRELLTLTVDVVVQMSRVEGRYRISEIYYEPDAKRRLAT